MNSIREKTDYRARYSTNEFSCDDSQYNFAKMSRDDDEEAGMTQFRVLFAAFTCCFIFGLVVSILALRKRNSNNKPLSKLLRVCYPRPRPRHMNYLDLHPTM